MKFHCDRCKTRYSISDERVRGKILKIRCKNCSAVISVREGMKQEPDPPAPHPVQPQPRAASRPVVAPRAPSPAPAPEPRPGSALEGAFEKALESSGAPDAGDSVSDAPASFEVEWYLAVEGVQNGPFTLAEAQAWVSRQALDEEVYCWSEGFDDWQLVEKVSHFRGLRAAAPAPGPDPSFGEEDEFADDQTAIAPPPDMMPSPQAEPPGPASPQPMAASGPPSGREVPLRAPSATPAPGSEPASAPEPREKTPEPLFAATMAQVAADAPTAVAEEPGKSNGSSASRDLLHLPPSGTPEEAASSAPAQEDMDLDIGEASRVVRLPVPSPGSAGPGEAQPAGEPGLPGVGGLGRGSGSHGALAPGFAPAPSAGPEAPRPELLQPRRRRGMLALLVGSGVVLVGVAVLLVILATGEEKTGEDVARTSVADENLAHQFSDPSAPGGGEEEESEEEGSEAEESSAGSARRRPRGQKRRRPSGGEGGERKTKTSFVPTGEVDLSGSGDEEEVIQGHLDPSEVRKAYRKHSFLTQRCYERARKRDPLLEVPKTNVFITVSPAGRVTKVTIPSLAGQRLASCLKTAIKRWKFPRSTKGLTTSFPLVFAK